MPPISTRIPAALTQSWCPAGCGEDRSPLLLTPLADAVTDRHRQAWSLALSRRPAIRAPGPNHPGRRPNPPDPPCASWSPGAFEVRVDEPNRQLQGSWRERHAIAVARPGYLAWELEDSRETEGRLLPAMPLPVGMKATIMTPAFDQSRARRFKCGLMVRKSGFMARQAVRIPPMRRGTGRGREHLLRQP